MISAKQITGLLLGSAPYVFKPGAPAGGPTNVFPTWAALQQASADFDEISVVLDDSLVSPVVIPAGSYPNVRAIFGQPHDLDANEETLVSLADGCQFPKCTRLGEVLNITAHGSVLSPFLLSDGQNLYVENQVVLRSLGVAGSILATPSDGPEVPEITVGVGCVLGPHSVDVNPQVVSPNSVQFQFTGGSLTANALNGVGPNAADASATLSILSAVSLANIVPTQPGIAGVAIDNQTATEVKQFSARAAGPTGIASTLTIAGWSNATALPGGEGSDPSAGVVMGSDGIKTVLKVSLRGDGSASGVTGTFQLLKNGVAVPGATFVLHLDGGINITVSSQASFISQHVFGDAYELAMTTSGGIGNLSQIVGVLA